MPDTDTARSPDVMSSSDGVFLTVRKRLLHEIFGDMLMANPASGGDPCAWWDEAGHKLAEVLRLQWDPGSVPQPSIRVVSEQDAMLLVEAVVAEHWRMQIHDRDTHGIEPVEFERCPESGCVTARRIRDQINPEGGRGGEIAGDAPPGTVGRSDPNARRSGESEAGEVDAAASIPAGTSPYDFGRMVPDRDLATAVDPLFPGDRIHDLDTALAALACGRDGRARYLIEKVRAEMAASRKGVDPGIAKSEPDTGLCPVPGGDGHVCSSPLRAFYSSVDGEAAPVLWVCVADHVLFAARPA